MKKLLLIIFIFLLIPSALSNSDNIYYTAQLGNSSTYAGIIGNENFGNFFDVGLLTIQEEILDAIQWFNNELFSNKTTSGAISHFILLGSVAGMVVLSETTQVPFYMMLSGLGMFSFAFLVLLSVSILIGVFIIATSILYLFRIPSIVEK